MSWDASFGGGDWNYTHNVAPMIYAVLKDAGLPLEMSWYKYLDGLSGREGAAYLRQIIAGLEADPGRFRAMNPPNGWGDYDSLLKTLREMKRAGEAGTACCDHECTNPERWRVTG